MLKSVFLPVLRITTIAAMVFIQLCLSSPVLAAGATTSVHLVRYADDGTTVLEEKTVDYKWMEKNLRVYGDGKTHYYHQGPIFEGDMWDSDETNNLKDKGAVKGTSVKDLCDLIGGMSPGGEIMFRAVDGWHAEFAYENIYEPQDRQGIIALCWFNGEDALEGERYGEGYPANNGYRTAMQIIFMAGTRNNEGKYVFGNADMQVCLTEERYQHFYEGLASTNGLTGKWITEIAIFPGQANVKPGEKLPPENDTTSDSDGLPIVPIILGGTGIVVISTSLVLILRKKKAA